MDRLVEKCSYAGKDIEIYQNEQSGLWSAYVRKSDGAYLLVRNHKTKEDVIYDLEYCRLAELKPRTRKLGE